MSLTVCPECSKLVQGSAQKCPFCGANFPQSLSLALASQDSKSDVKAILQTILSERFNHVETKEIKFRFGSRVLSYPSSMQLFARIYGKYYSVGQKLREKYYALYKSAGNIHTVLTSLTQQVIGDIDIVVQEAIKDLYDCGIMISDDNFKKKYNINFPYLIVSLYQQYEENLKEKQHIEINKEIKKAGRRWQGGGFGIEGAIKGAAKAEMLNFATEALHSLFGDNSDEARNRRELIEIYFNESNKEGFADSVYDCCEDILFGIGQEMADNLINTGNFHSNSEEVASIYENTIKFEKDPDRLFYNMVSCIQHEPENIKYYTPILQDLFEKNCDLKSFLIFWNLNELYDTLEESYRKGIIENINNPFVKNRCKTIIQIIGSPTGSSVTSDLDSGVDSHALHKNAVVVKGKVIKGEPTVIKSFFSFMEANEVKPLLSANIGVICNLNMTQVNTGCIGKTYYFILKISKENVDMLKNSAYLVDAESFSQPGSNLYATYEENGQKKVWGFVEESIEHAKYTHIFIKNDNYISNLGITFNSSSNEIRKIYGDAIERYFYAKNDSVSNAKYAVEFEQAEKFLCYNLLEEEYFIRFYFDKSQKLILVAYIKETDSKEYRIIKALEERVESGDIESKIALEHWDESKDLDLEVLFSSWIKAWQNDAKEQFHIANCYKCGTNIKQDDDMALNWYKKAAKNGHSEAKIILEHWEEFNDWKIENEENILSQYIKAWQGDSTALFELANDYKLNNDDNALEYYKKAAENGSPEAKTIVEHWEDFKNFETTDEDLILSWAKAFRGNANEQFNIGNAYKYGNGLERNNDVAMEWYRKAAENGHPDSKIIVDHWDEYKNLYPKDDYDKIISLWLKAWKGDAEAQYKLSVYFPNDSAESAFWREKAAKSGSIEAKFETNMEFIVYIVLAVICYGLGNFFTSSFLQWLFALGFGSACILGITLKLIKDIKKREKARNILIAIFIIWLTLQALL